eukprot:CAMPEP_0180703602 /NCGR_PEP_ID=MMETSP1038_2-20121128/6720_1 /TAXON_ID=632150 /ORGANISM="Azadinium spinosum, Strain 3D9" /LENGTH=745 /DNA_ID=CAMNT_0022735399 /DNA_START=74 /DNA_END=2308 /DNA_ORIENTATION=+
MWRYFDTRMYTYTLPINAELHFNLNGSDYLEDLLTVASSEMTFCNSTKYGTGSTGKVIGTTGRNGVESRQLQGQCVDLCLSVSCWDDQFWAVTAPEVIDKRSGQDIFVTTSFESVYAIEDPGNRSVRVSIFPGINGLAFELDISYTAAQPPNWFFGITPGQIDEATHQARVILLDSDKKVWRTPADEHETDGHFGKLQLTLPQIVFLAKPSTDNGLSQDSSSKIDESTMESGAEIEAGLDCFTDDYDISRYLGFDLREKEGIRAYMTSPLCFIHFEWITGLIESSAVGGPPEDWSEYNTEDYNDECTEVGLCDRSWYVQRVGIRLRSLPGRGLTRLPEMNAALVSLVSIIVLMAIPRQVMRFITIHFLGHLSAIYRKMLEEPLDIQLECGATYAKLISHNAAFSELADIGSPDHPGSQRISKQRMKDSLKGAFRYVGSSLGQEDFDAMVSFCVEMMIDRQAHGLRTRMEQDLLGVNSRHSEIEGDSINDETFCDVCTADETITYKDMLYLFDGKRRPHIIENLFTPRYLKLCSNRFVARQASPEREVAVREEEEGKGRPDLESARKFETSVAQMDPVPPVFDGDELGGIKRRLAAVESEVKELRRTCSALTAELEAERLAHVAALPKEGSETRRGAPTQHDSAKAALAYFDAKLEKDRQQVKEETDAFMRRVTALVEQMRLNQMEAVSVTEPSGCEELQMRKEAQLRDASQTRPPSRLSDKEALQESGEGDAAHSSSTWLARRRG